MEEKWGCIDVLVNNAGVNNPTDFDHITDDDWDEVLSTNLKVRSSDQEALGYYQPGAQRCEYWISQRPIWWAEQRIIRLVKLV